MNKRYQSFLLAVLLVSLTSCNHNADQRITAFSSSQTPASVLQSSSSAQVTSQPVSSVLSSTVSNIRSSKITPAIQLEKHCVSIKPVTNNKAAGATAIVSRSEVDGVKGTFNDPKLTESKRNLKGKRFSLATFWPQEYFTSDERIHEIEKDYNCNISVIPLNLLTYEKEIKSKMNAGLVFADIYDTQTEMNSLIKNGVFTDLQTVKTIGLKTNEWNPVFTLESSYKGGVYGVQVQQDRINRTVCFFNKAIASQYGLGNLYNMVNHGSWNINAFADFSAKVYSLSKGKIYGAPFFYSTSFIYSNGTAPVVNRNGRYVFNGTDNKVINIMDFLKKYNKAGLCDTHTENDLGKSEKAFENGRDLFFIGDLWECYSFHGRTPYGVLPLPMGPDVNSYTCLIDNARYFSISNGDPDTEDCGALITALAKKNVYTLFRVGTETE